MKKMVKKLSALLMAVIMVLAMSATAFAAKVEDTDLAQSITVSNLSEGVDTTLKLYNSNFPHQKWDSHLEKSIL